MFENVVAVPLNGLGGDYFTYVDRADFERVNQFKWRISSRTTKSGKTRNYVLRTACVGNDANGKRLYKCIYLHRFLLDAPDHLVVDHRNGNPLDNTRSNLRLATPSQNAANSQPMNRSKYGRGVMKVSHNAPRPFRATIRVNGVSLHLGYFATAHEAAAAYDRAAVMHYREFAVLNQPNPMGLTTSHQGPLPKAA